MLVSPVLRLSFLSLSEMWDAHGHVCVETERNAELKDTPSHLNFALGKCPQVGEMKMFLTGAEGVGGGLIKLKPFFPHTWSPRLISDKVSYSLASIIHWKETVWEERIMIPFFAEGGSSRTAFPS